jgi:hypothetical protein
MSTTPPLRSILCEQLSRILEETAFMLVEDRDAPLPAPAPAVEASICFTGGHTGALWLSVSEEGANHLAHEMLGDELANSPGYCEEATGELLNILTAWVLDAWCGKDYEHEMGTPSTARKPFDETTAWSLAEEQRVVVVTDAGFSFICGVAVNG